MNQVTALIAQAPFAQAIDLIGHCRGELDSVEALLIAKRTQDGHSNRSTEGIITGSGTVSKGEAKRRTTRANAVKENPQLAKKLAAGELSSEQVDLVAHAADKTEGDAANDTTLIDDIANANPDQGKAIVRKYLDELTTNEQRESRYQEQRRSRKVYKDRTSHDMARLIIEGDDQTIDSMLQQIKAGADRLYRADGGRDVPGHKHERTYNQRLFDAAMALFGQAQPAGRGRPCDANAEAGWGRPGSANADAPGDGSAGGSSGGTKSPDEDNRPTAGPAAATRSTQRPIMIFRSNIEDLTDDPEMIEEWTTELIGTGIVPESLASYYRCISDVAGQIVSGTGEVLWQGRAKRRATPGQWLALVVRDESCVRCGAHYSGCEAHHMLPWTAPKRGETNIDNMVLLCSDCHRRLHDGNKTIYRDEISGNWKVRPATAAETPARRPSDRTRRSRQPSRERKPGLSKPSERERETTGRKRSARELKPEIRA